MDMRKVTVAAIQMSCGRDMDANLDKAETMVLKAASEGAQIILLQELFATPYFCQKPLEKYYSLATGVSDNPAILRFSRIARENKLVLPISFSSATTMHLQFDRDSRRDGGSWVCTGNAHPRRRRLSGEFFFSPATPVFAYGTPHTARSASASAGSVVPETARCLALMARSFCSSRPRSAPNRWSRT
jgi:N-carbamoylputrescine amidase